MKNEEMARLFSEATPYIQKYHGRTMVIKYGGNAFNLCAHRQLLTPPS